MVLYGQQVHQQDRLVVGAPPSQIFLVHHVTWSVNSICWTLSPAVERRQ